MHHDDDLFDEVFEASDFVLSNPAEATVREQLTARGVVLSEVVVGGFIEADDYRTFCGFVTVPDLKTWIFETDDADRVTVLEERPLGELLPLFPAMNEAVEVARMGGIERALDIQRG